MVGQGKSHALGCIFKVGCELLDGTNYENIKKPSVLSKEKDKTKDRSPLPDIFCFAKVIISYYRITRLC